jgi:hypothetical protein
MKTTIDMAKEAGAGIASSGRWLMTQVELERLVALVRADEREKAKHNEEVLMNALWKACGDDGQLVEETIESQGELK